MFDYDNVTTIQTNFEFTRNLYGQSHTLQSREDSKVKILIFTISSNSYARQSFICKYTLNKSRS